MSKRILGKKMNSKSIQKMSKIHFIQNIFSRIGL